MYTCEYVYICISQITEIIILATEVKQTTDMYMETCSVYINVHIFTHSLPPL